MFPFNKLEAVNPIPMIKYYLAYANLTRMDYRNVQ
jgi:hypothetical protein